MTWTDLSRAVWRKSNHSAGNGGSQDCVEVATLEGGRIAVRDSKRPDGAMLLFRGTEMAALISGLKNNDFDHLI